MTNDSKQIDDLDDRMVEVYKNMTPQERLRIAFGLFHSARLMLTNYLRTSHPDWDENRLHYEVARRLSHGVI